MPSGNSPRRDRPFVPVNCDAYRALLESEMFGYEKGRSPCRRHEDRSIRVGQRRDLVSR